MQYPPPSRVAHISCVSAALGYLGGLAGYAGIIPAACLTLGYTCATEPAEEPAQSAAAAKPPGLCPSETTTAREARKARSCPVAPRPASPEERAKRAISGFAAARPSSAAKPRVCPHLPNPEADSGA